MRSEWRIPLAITIGLVAVVVLMLVGVVLSALIWRLQSYLLRWQPHNQSR